MQRNLLAVGIVAWALLGPAVCEALCLSSAPTPAHPGCHEAPATDRAPAPSPHSEMECCDEAIFASASPAQLLQVLLGPLPWGVASEAPEREPTVTARALPRPPDLPNSPYLRVTPPRLVYLG
ncbi:MAG: hypothetical protein NZ990_16470 [Myxococcota bacterium]|nr:hypothetical protein [Myxococcota bacterium]